MPADESGHPGHEHAHARKRYKGVRYGGRPAHARPLNASKVLVSLGHGSQQQLLDIARPTFETFARRFGYTLDLRTSAPPVDRPLAWAKVPIILELLDRYGTVLWVDADAVIVDFERDIAEALRAGSFMGLVEHTYRRDRVPNTGVVVTRSNARARAFWTAVWARSDLTDHPWWENAAVLALLGYRLDTWPRPPGTRFTDWPRGHSVRHIAWHLQCRLRDHLGIEILPVRPKRGAPPGEVTLLDKEWNSIPADPAPAPRIKHYAGETFEARVEGMAADVAQLRRAGALPGRSRPL